MSQRAWCGGGERQTSWVMMRSGWLAGRGSAWPREREAGADEREVSAAATDGGRATVGGVGGAIEAVAGSAVDVCLAGERQVTALCGLPQAQLTMAHRLKGSGGICANNRQMMCETWLCRRQSSGRLTASATGSAEVGGSCWGGAPWVAEWEIQIVGCPASPRSTRFMFTVADRSLFDSDRANVGPPPAEPRWFKRPTPSPGTLSSVAACLCRRPLRVPRLLSRRGHEKIRRR